MIIYKRIFCPSVPFDSLFDFSSLDILPKNQALCRNFLKNIKMCAVSDERSEQRPNYLTNHCKGLYINNVGIVL